MSIEGMRGALEEAMLNRKMSNPLPLIAAGAASAAGGMALGAAKKGGAAVMDMTEEVAPVVAEEALDMAKRGMSAGWGALKGAGKWLKGNPNIECPKCSGDDVFPKFKTTDSYYQEYECMNCQTLFKIDAKILNPQGGIGMNNQIVEEPQKNPPANPTLYEGVIDPTFLPEVAKNPPADESMDKLTAEWNSAPTPEAKKAIKSRVWKGATKMYAKAKKTKDEAAMAAAKKIMSWSAKHRVPKSMPKPIPNPQPVEVAPVVVPPVVVEIPAPAPVAANPAPEVGNPTPLPIINPPVEEKPAVTPKVEAKPVGCSHKFIYLGVANPKQGGKSMKVFQCTNCKKTFAKGA